MTVERPGATAAARRPRVFLVGYYGVANLGDEAIRIAIERAAAALGVDVAHYANRTPTDDPRAVPAGLRGIPAQARAILAVDRVVLGGGGILKDEGLRLPVELLATTLLARVLRRPVCLLAVGAGPFYRRSGRWLVRAIARLSRVRTVRDEDSASALRSLGVGRVLVGADPIFTMDSPVALPRTEGAGGPPPGPRAVISIRPWFHALASETEAAARMGRLRAGLASGLRPLLEAAWHLDLVSMYWPRDRDASRDLLTGLGGAPGTASVVDRELVWDDLAGLVAGADLVVAMRYHAVAAAALAGRPTIAIAYEPKVASLASDLSIPAIAVDDPDLGTGLAALTAAAVTGDAPPAGDATALDALRQRAWSALRAALLD